MKIRTELLRDDEREAVNFPVGHVMLFVDRLIEEREISNQYLDQLTEARLQIVKLQAELGDGIH